MPEDHDKDVYPEPPSRTPVVDRQSVLPDPTLILSKLFYYSVDLPVTTFRAVWTFILTAPIHCRGSIDIVEGIQSGKKSYYYHQKFRRVPELTQCRQGDYVCYYEAEMQWRRDYKVDQEIVKVIQERLRACQQREGPSYRQNCYKELQQFEQVSKAFQSRYGDLGAYASARKCLMKQKERMMAEQQKA